MLEQLENIGLRPNQFISTHNCMLIKAPKKHPIIPNEAKWLSGEGAGSWFHFYPENGFFQITRFSPNGNVECSGIFNASQRVDLDFSYEISYPSHCQIISIIQQGERITFKRFSD